MQINPLNFFECYIAFSSSSCLKNVSNYGIHFLSEMQFSIIQSVRKIESRQLSKNNSSITREGLEFDVMNVHA